MIEIISKIPEFLSLMCLVWVTMTLKRIERIEKREDEKISKLELKVEKLESDIVSINLNLTKLKSEL